MADESVGLSGVESGTASGDAASAELRAPLSTSDAVRVAPRADDLAFQQAVGVLQAPPPRVASLALWAISALAVLSFFRGGVQELLALVVALLIHEGGHWLAMRVFGYQDLRVFFIPFFGAAASGRKTKAPGWQRGVVLLAGPFPGLVLACPLVMFGGFSRDLGLILLVINTFNLLPIHPFDGGRLVGLVFFSRAPILEVAFSFAGGLALVWLGVSSGIAVLSLLGGLVMLSVPPRWRTLQAARRFRATTGNDPAGLPEDVAHADDATLVALFAATERQGESKQVASAPKLRASRMRAAYEAALLVPPGWRAVIGLGVLYAAAWVTAGVALGVKTGADQAIVTVPPQGPDTGLGEGS